MLRSKNVTYEGYDFLALEVRVPADGLSKSSNWCFDYQYLCEDFHRRPTGCGGLYNWTSGVADCGQKYNSDMNIGYSLRCSPSYAIASLANNTFPNSMSLHANHQKSFGFFNCSTCSKTIQGSMDALTYMSDFWVFNDTRFYTVCR